MIQTPAYEDRLRRLQEKVSYLKRSQTTQTLVNPYLICDQCGGPHEVDESTTEHVYLSGHDIFDDPSLLVFYQASNDTSWGNYVKKKEGEKGPEFKVRSAFEEDLGHFTHEKSLLLKGLDGLITEQQKEMSDTFADLHAALGHKSEPRHNQQDSLFSITTHAGTTTKDPPYPTQHTITTRHDTSNREENEKDEETSEQPPRVISSVSTQPKQPTKFPYPLHFKNQRTENDNKIFLSYLKDYVVIIPLIDACY